MRCFIAIELPDELKDKLVELQKDFRDLGVITFVKREQIHLTLKFFGEISEKKVEQIKEKLKQIKFNSFRVKLSRLGVFPDESFIRVLWVGLENGEIYELQSKIDNSLVDLFEKDKRFHAHLTLGRVKSINDKEKFLEKLKLSVEGEFLVKEFHLVNSISYGEGYKYSILEIYKLKV